MLKLTASVSKEPPLESVEFSTNSASAGIEVEMPCAANSEEIRCRLKQIYAMLEFAVVHARPCHLGATGAL